MLLALLAGMSPKLPGSDGGLPAPGYNKVAYYVFDSGGPDHFPLTTFTDVGNIVVLFEGKLWELVDSVHYATGWMRNVNYHSYAEIIRDVRALQARGVKVLMNVDDAPSWSTAVPFTTYDGQPYDYQQFASFLKTCAIDSLHLDGICLDVEHKATGNAAYVSLLKEIGKHFGPLSSNGTSQMYIAAIYSGATPGSVIGKSRDIGAYFNFVMDMAYFNSNFVSRFNQWADSLGPSHVMVGVLNDYFDLAYAAGVAAWQPAIPPKAGVMVYAANNLKSYTDAVFNALTVPVPVRPGLDPPRPAAFTLLQNYPNPFNPTSEIRYQIAASRYVTLGVYDLLGRQITMLVQEVKRPGTYTAHFDGRNLPSGAYFYRLQAGDFHQTKTMLLLK